MKRPLKRFQELYINLSYPGWICLPVLNKDNACACNYRSDNSICVDACLICKDVVHVLMKLRCKDTAIIFKKIIC